MRNIYQKLTSEKCKQCFRWHRILALRIYNVKEGDFCKLKFESVPR